MDPEGAGRLFKDLQYGKRRTARSIFNMNPLAFFFGDSQSVKLFANILVKNYRYLILNKEFVKSLHFCKNKISVLFCLQKLSRIPISHWDKNFPIFLRYVYPNMRIIVLRIADCR
jgi:hypothetical protein